MAFAVHPSTQGMTFTDKIVALGTILSLPLLVVPAVLFIFLKARYALRVLGFLMVLLLVGQLLMQTLDPVINEGFIKLLGG